MTFDSDEIRSRLRLGEDSTWEFKAIEFTANRPTGPSRSDWSDEIAAFANADGGVLICGVTDEGEVQGMSREQMVALDSLLVEVSTDTIKPAVRIRTYHREVEGKRLLLVEIPQGDTQYDSSGGSYVRVGGTKRRMTSDERLRLAQRRGQARFSSYDEQTIPGTGFNTLDESLWRPLLSVEGASEPEAGLTKLAMLANDDAGILRATVAGVLICTRHPEEWLANAGITATRYRGADRASGQIDAQEIAGPINQQIGDAIAFALRNIRVASRKDPARVDLPQYSERVLFEAIVNAVVHRDYSIRSSKIRLSIFEDRVEVQSPGSLPNNLTIDGMTDRQATRNEALTSVLARMPVGGIGGAADRQYMMERRGDGVQIILRETRELSGKLPEYRLIDGSEVRLVIPAAVLDQSPDRAVIAVRSGGQPLPGAAVLALFPNKTWKDANTDENGEATVDLYTTHLPMTVFAAATGHCGYVEREWVPNVGTLSIDLQPLRGGGSLIFAEGTGYLPVVKGRLNPIRDTHDRTYLYASNIAIDQGKQQPVSFTFAERLRLTDADGREATVRILDVTGRSALLEYQPVN